MRTVETSVLGAVARRTPNKLTQFHGEQSQGTRNELVVHRRQRGQPQRTETDAMDGNQKRARHIAELPSTNSVCMQLSNTGCRPMQANASKEPRQGQETSPDGSRRRDHGNSPAMKCARSPCFMDIVVAVISLQSPPLHAIHRGRNQLCAPKGVETANVWKDIPVRH